MTQWYCTCKGKTVRELAYRDCTACQVTMPITRPIAADRKVLAERKWQAPTKAPRPQQPCDHGLFSDEADQLDLCEMLQDPTNGE